MSKEEGTITFLERAAATLDGWAESSLHGGWSTHQVGASRKLADDCRREASRLRRSVAEIDRLLAAPNDSLRLVEIDLSKADRTRHPEIDLDRWYLAQIASGLHCGRFSMQWYGLNFFPWGTSGCQFDAPGTNASMWERLWLIEGWPF